MKLMHSLPQQISITHRNGPHLRPSRYKKMNKYEGGGEGTTHGKEEIKEHNKEEEMTQGNNLKNNNN